MTDCAALVHTVQEHRASLRDTMARLEQENQRLQQVCACKDRTRLRSATGTWECSDPVFATCSPPVAPQELDAAKLATVAAVAAAKEQRTAELTAQHEEEKKALRARIEAMTLESERREKEARDRAEQERARTLVGHPATRHTGEGVDRWERSRKG